MNLKQTLIRKLWVALSPHQQQALVYDFLDWLYFDLLPAQHFEKANRLTPRLMEIVDKGEIGLSLILCEHLKCLPFVSTMSRSAGTPISNSQVSGVVIFISDAAQQKRPWGKSGSAARHPNHEIFPDPEIWPLFNGI